MGSNPTQGMDVWCMCLFCVCVVLCLGRGLATVWSLIQGVLWSVKIMKLKEEARAHWGYRASGGGTGIYTSEGGTVVLLSSEIPSVI
jgi:hypothetical protein